MLQRRHLLKFAIAAALIPAAVGMFTPTASAYVFTGQGMFQHRGAFSQRSPSRYAQPHAEQVMLGFYANQNSANNDSAADDVLREYGLASNVITPPTYVTPTTASALPNPAPVTAPQPIVILAPPLPVTPPITCNVNVQSDAIHWTGTLEYNNNTSTNPFQITYVNGINGIYDGWGPGPFAGGTAIGNVPGVVWNGNGTYTIPSGNNGTLPVYSTLTDKGYLGGPGSGALWNGPTGDTLGYYQLLNPGSNSTAQTWLRYTAPNGASCECGTAPTDTYCAVTNQPSGQYPCSASGQSQPTSSYDWVGPGQQWEQWSCSGSSQAPAPDPAQVNCSVSGAQNGPPQQPGTIYMSGFGQSGSGSYQCGTTNPYTGNGNAYNWSNGGSMNCSFNGNMWSATSGSGTTQCSISMPNGQGPWYGSTYGTTSYGVTWSCSFSGSKSSGGTANCDGHSMSVPFNGCGSASFPGCAGGTNCNISTCWSGPGIGVTNLSFTAPDGQVFYGNASGQTAYTLATVYNVPYGGGQSSTPYYASRWVNGTIYAGWPNLTSAWANNGYGLNTGNFSVSGQPQWCNWSATFNNWNQIDVTTSGGATVVVPMNTQQCYG
ncbi:hypothetical protein HAP94_11020 [Acidithiobacillus ferrivorans]|nr:hypothetical protein [Acidithiobacillus ferrivorans]